MLANALFVQTHPQKLRLRHRERLRRERRTVGLWTCRDCRNCARKPLKSLRSLHDTENENSAKRADSRARSLERQIGGLASAGGASEES